MNESASVQFGGLKPWITFRHHAPDAPMVFALAHVVGFDELLGEEAGVVDPAAVDVADVDGAVGAGGEVHGAAPFVAAAEEFRAVADAGGGLPEAPN